MSSTGQPTKLKPDVQVCPEFAQMPELHLLSQYNSNFLLRKRAFGQIHEQFFQVAMVASLSLHRVMAGYHRTATAAASAAAHSPMLLLRSQL